MKTVCIDFLESGTYLEVRLTYDLYIALSKKVSIAVKLIQICCRYNTVFPKFNIKDTN